MKGIEEREMQIDWQTNRTTPNTLTHIYIGFREWFKYLLEDMISI